MSTYPSSVSAVASEVVRAFLEEYFGAWQGTDIDSIMSYYTDEIVLQLPTGELKGKELVRDHFVRPFVAAFPGNQHIPQNIAYARNLVAVEWIFDAVHKGDFLGIPATHRRVRVPGCSFYEHDLERRLIVAGRIYFDPASFSRQLQG